MKKVMSIFLAVCMMTAFTACSNKTETSNSDSTVSSPSPSESVSSSDTDHSQSESENSLPIEASQPTEEEAKTNILIAYFTWAENTRVDNPDSVDVDAVTSASVLMPGNVGLLAQWIAEETGGDKFSILTEQPYSSDYDTCLNRAIEEHDDGVRPAIKGHVDNMDDYSIVFLGFPNWWYSCPMAILTFIEEHDLSGKTVIPFCAHGTGGFAASLRDIGKELPKDCTVLEEFGAYRPEVASSKDKLLNWLSGLNIDY